MRLIVDSREQCPYLFQGPRYEGVLVESGTLQTADYSLAGLTDRVGIERKSIDDMAGTLTQGRERFTREMERARAFDLFAIVIEATMHDAAHHTYRSRMKPQSFLQSLFAFQVRYGVHIVWAGDRAGGEYVTYSLLQKYLKEQQTRLSELVKAHGTGGTAA